MNRNFIEHKSTLFLKIVIFLIGLLVLGVCVVVLPLAIRAEMRGDFDYGPIFLGLYIPAIPFFISLYQALKLLGYIDQNKAFSNLSSLALKNIKNCAVSISLVFTLGMPYIFIVGDRDDAPGIVLVALIIIFASIVIGAFAGLLEKLIQNGTDIKSENELTV